MDIETMKMAAQIIQNLAASGKEAFIWWLMVEGALPRLLFAGMAGSGFYAAYRIARLIYDQTRVQQSYDKAERAAFDTVKELGLLMKIPGAEWPSDTTVTLIKRNIIAAIGTAAMKKQEEK